MKQQVVTLFLGQVSRDVRGRMFTLHPAKSAPSYYEMSVPQQVVIGEETVSINSRPVVFQLRGYSPDVLLIRTTIEVDDVFQQATFDLEEKAFAESHRLFAGYGGNLQFSEAYSIFVVANYPGRPEDFFTHRSIIASLLKSERIELDPREIDYTLQSQIRYGKNDLSIIDWDGAFLFDPEGDVEEEITLLTLANLQLLRHRVLDGQLDRRLARMGSRVRGPDEGRMVFRHREMHQDLVEIIRDRMLSISELQRLEQEIKLIGDWYSARFYDLATTKFKIDDWRKAIQSKLDSIEDIYSVVAENFAVSTKHRAEWVQIILFFILQIGWFVLIILEFTYFTRK